MVPVALFVLLVPAPARAQPAHSPQAPTTSGSATASAGVAAMPPASALTRARTLYTRGVDHNENKQWKEAYEALHEAWGLKQHWQIAMMLGWAEMELGKIRAAIAHLTFAAMATEPRDESYSDRIGVLLRDAESRLAHLRIAGVPAGAKVMLDGELLGIAPILGPVAADPGTRTITAELGSRRVSQAVIVAAPVSTPDQEHEAPTVTLAWPKDPAPGVDDRQSATGSAGPSLAPGNAGSSLTPVVLLGAAAGLGVAIGGVLMGVSVAREGEAARKLEAVMLAPRPCNTPRCQQIDGLLAERDALGSAALGVWVGSAILATAAAGTYLLQRRAPQSSAMTWAPVVSAHGAGLLVGGAF